MSSAAESSGFSRRHILQAGAAGIVLYGFHLPRAQAEPAAFAPNAFIRIAGDGGVP